MQILSPESEQVIQQIEKQCGFTSNKKEIRIIFTLHVYKLERNIKYLQSENVRQLDMITNLKLQLKISQQKYIQQESLVNQLQSELQESKDKNSNHQYSINNLEEQLNYLLTQGSHMQYQLSPRFFQSRIISPKYSKFQFFDSAPEIIISQPYDMIERLDSSKCISKLQNLIWNVLQKDNKYADEIIQILKQSQSKMNNVMNEMVSQLIRQKNQFSKELDGVIKDEFNMQPQIKKYLKIRQIRKSQKLILSYTSQLKKQILWDSISKDDGNLIKQINHHYKDCLQKVQSQDDGAKIIEQYCETIKIQNIYELQQLHIDIFKYDHLKQLNISNCMISDNHIDIFNKCSLLSLIKFDISGNNITDKFIICISELLKQIIDLNICFTDITDISVRVICKSMRRGRVLDISYTKVSERCVEYLTKMRDLQKLSIWSGQKEYPDYYQQYLQEKYQSNLEKYKQNNIRLSEKYIRTLSQLKLNNLVVNLHKQNGDIILTNNKECIKNLHVNAKMKTKLMKQLLSLNNINKVQLKIRQIKIAKTILKEGQNKKLSIQNLERYKTVEQVIVNEFNINKEKAYLEVEPIIKELQMPHSNIKKQYLSEIARKLQYLTKLNLYDNSIDDEGAMFISRNLKNLTSLDLSWNNIRDRGIIQITNNLKNLINLNLSFNHISKEGAYQIAHNLTCLTSLDLRNNNIGDEGIIQIAIHLKSLINLKLWNNNINDDGAFYIAQHLKNLVYLDLRNNSISNNGAIQIIMNLKHLTYLDLKCNKIEQSQKSQITALSKSKTLLLI